MSISDLKVSTLPYDGYPEFATSQGELSPKPGADEENRVLSLVQSQSVERKIEKDLFSNKRLSIDLKININRRFYNFLDNLTDNIRLQSSSPVVVSLPGDVTNNESEGAVSYA